MYVYESFERGLWTVGYYRPDGKFMPESDHGSTVAAAARVHFLNGGKGQVNADLLAACKAVSAWLDACEYGSGGHEQMQKIIEDAIAAAEAR